MIRMLRCLSAPQQQGAGAWRSLHHEGDGAIRSCNSCWGRSMYAAATLSILLHCCAVPGVYSSIIGRLIGPLM